VSQGTLREGFPAEEIIVAQRTRTSPVKEKLKSPIQEERSEQVNIVDEEDSVEQHETQRKRENIAAPKTSTSKGTGNADDEDSEEDTDEDEEKSDSEEAVVEVWEKEAVLVKDRASEAKKKGPTRNQRKKIMRRKKRAAMMAEGIRPPSQKRRRKRHTKQPAEVVSGGEQEASSVLPVDDPLKKT